MNKSKIISSAEGSAKVAEESVISVIIDKIPIVLGAIAVVLACFFLSLINRIFN